jgi:predicted GTPase
MSKTRVAVIAALFLSPFVFLTSVGGYHLYHAPGPLGFSWLFWTWWPLFLTFALSYYLAYRWTRRSDLPPTDHTAHYWTERDATAWEKVTTKAKSFERVTTDQLANAKHYTELSLDLAKQVADVYNPGAEDPFEHLTVPEVLACVELASAELDELVQKYVPGVHMLRVRDYKTVRKAADWYRTGQNLYWAGAAVLNPVEVGLRWLATRYALGSLFSKVQDNVLLWFHTAFIHETGRYLIELNSGRLKVGVKRYRELLAAHQTPPTQPDTPPAPADLATTPAPPEQPGEKPIGVAVLGAVKAGKSSLVNALLGEQAATVDTLPVAHVGIKHRVTLPGGQPLSVLDTAGYGQEGPSEAEFAAAAEAAQDADLILLVTQATNPGRKPDVDLLDRLKAWFAERPQLKLPPVIAVVNQVDLLSPKAEWAPPYDWRAGVRPKETTIRDCVGVVREQLGPRASDVIPVCARHGETWGITDGLVPVMAALLDAARGAAVLRAFHAEAASERLKKLGGQLVEGGKQALKILLQSLKK